MSGQADRTIKPGASEEITALLSLKTGGKCARRITVTTNDPTHKREYLEFKGEILVPFKATPAYAQFAKLDDYTTPEPRKITLRRGDGGPLQLELAGVGKPGIEASLREIKAGEHYELTVSLVPPLKPGRLYSWVKLKTGIKEVAESRITVSAVVPPTWGEEPDRRSASR